MKDLTILSALAASRQIVAKASRPKSETTKPIESPVVEPDGQVQSRSLPEERIALLNSLVATAEAIRGFGLSVAMLNVSGGLIEYDEGFGPSIWSKAGFSRMYSIPAVVSIAIPADCAILAQGNLDVFDYAGARLYPKTLVHVAKDGSKTHIYRAPQYLDATPRTAIYRDLSLKSGVPYLDVFQGGTLTVHDGPEQLAIAPDAFVSALISGVRR
jgi:hypothetical protein